jgi:hypothetical protein
MKQQTKEGKEFKKAYELFIKSKRTYVGLVALLEDRRLKPAARILFHIISSLSYVEGYCYATNETLGNKLGLKKSMIKQYLQELEANQIIEIKIAMGRYRMCREIYIRFDMLYKRYPVEKKS